MVVEGEPNKSYTLITYVLPMVSPKVMIVTVSPQNPWSQSINVPPHESNNSTTGPKLNDPPTCMVGFMEVARKEYHTSSAVPKPQTGKDDCVALSTAPAVGIQIVSCVKDIAFVHSSLIGCAFISNGIMYDPTRNRSIKKT